MTLQQLKYAITVAESGTITEAATRLYISQPSLTNAIRELEKEMNITIEHDRENSGINVEKSKGFSIDSGYMSDAMRSLCEDQESWKKSGAWIALLKEGIMSQVGLGEFFKSIPEEHVNDLEEIVMEITQLEQQKEKQQLM